MAPEQKHQSGLVLYASLGYTTHDNHFLAAIVEAGWEVVFVRFDGRQDDLDERPLPSGTRHVDWLGTEESLQPSNIDEFVSAFGDLLHDLSPSIVHAGPVPTVGFVAARAGASPLITVSWGSDLLIQAQHEPYRAQSETALAASNAVFVDSVTVCDTAIALRADPAHVITFPWGIDLVGFPYRPIHPGAGPLQVLSLRSLEAVYDVETLVRATAIVLAEGLNLSVTIAGGGSLCNGLQALATELGCDAAIDFIGRVPESAVSDLLAANDIHVSTAVADGSSISLLQAMATGRPSVVSEIPSNLEWVTPNVTGWTFKAGDSRSLAEALAVANARRDSFGGMGQACRAVAQARADWSINKLFIDRTYRRVLRLR